jgi:hypothetical protein
LKRLALRFRPPKHPRFLSLKTPGPAGRFWFRANAKPTARPAAAWLTPRAEPAVLALPAPDYHLSGNSIS